MHIYLETSTGYRHACEVEKPLNIGDALLVELIFRGALRKCPMLRRLRISKICDNGNAIAVIDHD